MEWVLKHKKATPEMLGFIPEFLNEDDPRPAKEQLDSNYSHGGVLGRCRGLRCCRMVISSYPGDPPFALLAEPGCATR
jgi:hypothetical protein